MPTLHFGLQVPGACPHGVRPGSANTTSGCSGSTSDLHEHLVSVKSALPNSYPTKRLRDCISIMPGFGKLWDGNKYSPEDDKQDQTVTYSLCVALVNLKTSMY